ncbi:hypothetical protein HUG10_11240 [Halorarum halophilum]|uniref:Uncharacterized protein n=1 Tax=Halorarum halophilum TaxID=2743090 RepID=A0A7D5GC97_9EURY|nr:hypothetical protein [Halobaculum halophilum]QLG28092.1 hypothetical protein HUG10_11240 [Halobaculum halophilum]
MRPIARNGLLLLVGVVVALLALGALPQFLAAGDPYYLAANEADDGPALDVGNFSQQQYPYLFEALASDDGRSSAYRRGPWGLKEAFTNSPFDELQSLREFAPAGATTEDAAFVTYEGTRYRIEVIQE